MRKRIFAVLTIAVLAGGSLAYGTYTYMQPAAPAAADVRTQPVVLAASDLQLGAQVQKDDLMVVPFPEGSVPAGTFSNPDDVVGVGVVSPIVKHEPILKTKLAAKEAGTGLPPVIPEGMRAISVRVDEVIGVAGYVLPGNHVDVVTTASPTSDHADVTSKIVLSNVQVLTAGTRMEQSAEDGKPVAVNVVTLLVRPEQTERLALASTEGKIQLALRNPLDQGAPETPGIKPAALLGSGSSARPPAPAPRTKPAGTKPAAKVASAPAAEAAPPAPTVEIIRGDKRATEVIR
jgi:pilus assembly protein CpaB